MALVPIVCGILARMFEPTESRVQMKVQGWSVSTMIVAAHTQDPLDGTTKQTMSELTRPQVLPLPGHPSLPCYHIR